MYGIGSEPRPQSRTSTRVLRVLALCGVIGWILFIALRIHAEPPPGSPSPRELALAYESALNSGHADQVAPLLGEPVVGNADVAEYLVGQPHEGRWHVAVVDLDGATFLAVNDDRGLVVHLPTTSVDGHWQVNPLVSPR
ncbi:hypothetical protein ACFFQW_22640 [Umezawaea endophytica]|uniref:Uncharacterized protein n=1 Tax=Umezawaea endophytica TaxID=1654476 RepID=A0A9X3A0U0_9PSEU|nr:hypothetical protein [Umezawaea endophytica]MCS7477298.1 hypothetical protein [Umezawaea endophytica]